MAGLKNFEQENYLSSFYKHDDILLKEMEDYARINSVPILDKSSASFLEHLILVNKPKTFLEIGTAIGYSTIRVAKNVDNNTMIDTIELSKDCFELADNFISRSGLKSKINLIMGNALDIIPKLKTKYDFIFLDADKYYYFELLELAVKKLNVNGIILIDNLLWKGYVVSSKVPEKYKKSTELIKEFNAKFFSYPGLKSTILPIGDGIGLGVKVGDN